MNLQSFYDQINSGSVREYARLSLPTLIDQVCDEHPNNIAVRCGEETLSYAELKRNSNVLANYLLKQNIAAGDRVGVLVRRDVNLLSLLLGIMKSGAAYVPLDADYPDARLAFMVEDSGIAHLLTDEDHHLMAKSFGVETTNLDLQKSEIESTSADPIAVVGDPVDNIAYVIYTSGSTGQPKGVLVPQGGVVNMLYGLKETLGFRSNDRMLATTTLAFDISVVEIMLPLICGGSVVVVDRQTAKDSLELVSVCEKQSVSVMFATPAMWRMILEADFDGRSDMVFLTGGEPLAKDLVAPMLQRCKALWNLYGPTETTVYSTLIQIKDADERILIGRPAANTSVFVVDEENQLCPPETRGELLIGGDGVTAGYLNREELTAEKFIEFNGQRVYRTGDLARVTADGLIDCLGRIDGQIKLNGHRIELEEIDAALGALPGIRMAATALRQDRPGDKRLVGYLVVEEDCSIDLATTRAKLSETLPEYMVPALLTTIDELPLTPNGKLNRKELPVPDVSRQETGTEFVAPRSDEEKQLTGIFGEVLQIEGVGVDDNFFQMGGNSIRAVRAVAMIRKSLAIEISNAEFFDNPTPRQILNLAAKKDALQNRFSSDQESGSNKATERSEESGEYAIVGMAARFPGASDVHQFWNNLVEGRESISFFRPEELDPTLDPRDTSDPNYVAARGIVEDADKFDASFFKIMPKAAELIDPQQRLMLEIAWTALEDAGIMPGDQHTIGVWAGTYSTTYYINNVLTNPEKVREAGAFQVSAYSEKDFIATRVAHALNLTGPAINVNTACSTSLVTLVEACKSLAFGHCDVAIAGAASVQFPQISGHLHQPGSIFTPDGHCRPFDADGQGTLFSDGAGAVVVKRLADAVADGDRIYAVVKGTGINNDGGDKASFSAPSIAGQAGAIAMAQSDAGITPDMIGYVEAHGTATPVGDPIEVAALQTVFDAQTDKRQYCAIGSVKSNIGHAVAAAGVAGLIKATLSLHHEKIPATLHFNNANPQIDFANSPFYVCDALTDWKRDSTPRIAAVSAFGVGGTNAHVVMEEAPAVVNDGSQPDDQRLPVTIVPVSGKSEAALMENVKNLAAHLNAHSTLAIDDVAHTLQNGRAHFAWRGAMVCHDLKDAAGQLASAKAPRFMKRKTSPSTRDVVFMFPGQGSQYVRMGQDLYQHSSIFRENLDRCAEKLLPLLGRDLREVLFPESGEEEASTEILRNTQFTQPALFSIGYALAKVWMAWGIQPTALIGHSIGEFAAACVAGVFSLEDGLEMIAERGRAMQALPGGSMMSVRLPGSKVEPMLWGDMAIGSYNGPELCVVAGPDNEVADLQKQLEAEEVVCRHLHTSHAFHSPMMNSIVAPFKDFISQFELNAPTVPILSTVTGDWMTDEQATDAAYWADHLRQPVQFSGAVTRMWDEDPTRILIELGPRRTLATLAKQHANDPKNQTALPTLGSSSANNAEWTSTLSAVAQLWLAGVDVHWSKLTGNGQPVLNRKVALPTYAFQRKRHFLDPPTDAGKPTKQDHSNVTQDTIYELSSSSPQTTQSSTQETVIMSRIPNIVAAIESVFENTSGFELQEFEGDTTFFEMGLDSLVLTQTATALKKEMGIEITFRQLLEETPNVDSLAAWFDENLPADQYQAVATTATIDVDAGATEEALSPAVTSAQNTPSTPLDAQPIAPVAVPQPPATIATSAIQPLAAPIHGDATQALLHGQLQLMQAQLQLLAGQPMAAHTQASPLPAAVSTETPTDVSAPVATAEDPQAIASSAIAQGAPAVAPTPSPLGADSKTTEAPKKAKRFSTVKLNDGTLDEKQQKALDDIIRMNCAMMPKSKAYAQTHRRYLADPRTVSGFRPNMKEMTHPIVVERSSGVNLWDLDGNEYTDFTCGFGSNLLGHSHPVTVKAITEQVQKDYAIGPQTPLAGEVAKLFCELTGNERMAFSNTGSEAVLGCTRLARNKTGRDLIVMFNGDYHGILDEVLSKGNKKQKSFPAAMGIPKKHVENTLILEYGTDEALNIIRERLDEIAAILIEPVQSQKPELQPREFLQELRRMTEKEPTALIFDEVITGLRVGYGGAQEFFGVKADLAAYGKVVGGGMPIGVLAGKAEYMDGLDGGYWEFGDDSRPEAGMTYFAGTFVRHPLTLAASKAILLHLKEGGQAMYDRLNQLTDYMREEMNRIFEELDAPMYMANFGSLFKIQFHQELIYSEIFFAGLRRRGMHIWDHRPCLLTIVHEKHHVDELLAAMRDTIVECQRHGFMPGEGYKTVSIETQESRPPQKGAKLGKDPSGNPGWFVPDMVNPGQFVQVGIMTE